MATVATDTAGRRADRIESLLSARLFIQPQLADDRIYVVSNLSGHLSLYALDASGGVPEPLLPPQIALQNPDLVGGELFHVLPGLGQILVTLDANGDENYVPHVIPLDGGFPEPLADEVFAFGRSHLVAVDDDTEVAFFAVESREEALTTAVRVDLASGTTEILWRSRYGGYVGAWTPDLSRVVLIDGYTMGDVVLYEIDGAGDRSVLWGTPLEERDPESQHPLSGFRAAHGTIGGRGLLLTTTLYDDTGSLAFLDLSRPGELEPVALEGLRHEGTGELEGLEHLEGSRYALTYNIDGCSWVYAGVFDETVRAFQVERVLVGEGALTDGVLHGLHYDSGSGRFAVAFCTATSPTQLHVLPGRRAAGDVDARACARRGADVLAAGEDASFESHDGLRVSARLYLPSSELGYEGPRPLVYYVHGGPQSQERPDFAWFSMPLVQILTLEGFAVFVPNARGSTGYGLDYSKRVDRDWGGLDRLDHVHAMTEVLPHDDRIDATRTGVAGRSYGGYMTLTLAARHPELWRAAVDMFGPYDLFTFIDRLPETWKPYFALAVGDPEADSDFLTERSPKTHIADISCPLLVIQGRNDPRVVERESHDVVEQLRELGREVDYLVFDDEGHDVLKLGNRVRCYDTIVGFFTQHLS